MVMKGKKSYLQAGAGIVADSDPQREFEESENKARAVLRAVEMARGNRIVGVSNAVDPKIPLMSNR
jgi:anthranilate/para-aminobenzoate synthase component I